MKLLLTSGRPDDEPPQTRQTCVCHVPPFDLRETIDQSRRGWIRSNCRLCGAFIGYRPAGKQSQKFDYPESN